MTNKLKERLRKQISALFRGRDYSQVEKFFISCRKVIEGDSLKEKFPAIYFYANWVSHYVIDRQCHEILAKINIGFREIYLPNSERAAKRQNYTDVVIDALMLDQLLNEVIDFAHIYIDDMPIIDGNIYVNGKLVPLKENHEKTKFLTANGNLDCGVKLISVDGSAERIKFLLKIFTELEGIEIKFPDVKIDSKKERISQRVKEIMNEIDMHKGKITGLSPEVDYTKFYLINSLAITKVEGTQVKYQLGIEDQNITIKSGIDFV